MASMILELDACISANNIKTWHGLETLVTEMSPDEAHKLAMDFDVATEQVMSTDGVIIPNWYVIVRTDLERTDVRRFLGESKVSALYEPVQNIDITNMCKPLIDLGCTMETAGSLENGKRVYCSVRLPQTVKIKDDILEDFVVLSSSHTGAGGIKGTLSNTRPICSNTLAIAFRNGTALNSNCVSFKHVAGSIDIESAKAALIDAKDHFEKTALVFTQMANTRINDAFRDSYIKAIMPTADEENIHTKTKNRRAAVVDLFEGSAKGADQDACKGTVYGLFQATTEYLDHHRPTRCGSDNPEDQNVARWSSSNFGQGAEVRQKAFELLASNIGGSAAQLVGSDQKSVLELEPLSLDLDAIIDATGEQ